MLCNLTDTFYTHSHFDILPLQNRISFPYQKEKMISSIKFKKVLLFLIMLPCKIIFDIHGFIIINIPVISLNFERTFRRKK